MSSLINIFKQVLREKTADQRILLFIGTTLKGRIWMDVANSCLRQNGRKGRKLTSIVAGNGFKDTGKGFSIFLFQSSQPLFHSCTGSAGYF